jgi:serine protease DegQ
MTRFISYVVIFILGFAACAGVYNTLPQRNLNSSLPPGSVSATGALGPAVAPTTNPSAVPGPGTTIYAVAQVEPSVVNIDITGKPQPVPSEMSPFGMPFGFQGMPQEETPKGEASGVIISPDGYILTNNHVASDASTINVTLHDGRRFKATTVGLDPRSDLAVIKIDANNLPAATLGNSADVKLGQDVIAVGNPLGIGVTATHGIISAIRSPFPLKGKVFPQILQTDAAINPGNSGGALADLDGHIIGINTAIASTSGGSIGIGFAIPINLAKQHAEELIKDKTVTYPWLGIRYSPIEPNQPLPVTGVLVGGVVPGSPAAKAGIQQGDVITQINDRKIDEADKVNYFITQHQPGDTITVTIWRKGQTLTQQVTLTKMPANLENAQGMPEQPQMAPQEEGPQGGAGGDVQP